MSQNFSLHENYRDEEPLEAGSARTFGCALGTILIVIGVAKALMAGAIALVACFSFAAGAVLLLLGIVAPSRLSALNAFCLKLGGAIAKVVNPIVLGFLFFLVVTPMALFMGMVGKRPLRIAPDRNAATYWIKRELRRAGESNMTRQF
jgi:hypothetical protein